MKPTIKCRIAISFMVLCAAILCVPVLTSPQTAQRRQNAADSFFIISSVDAKKHQIVLKLPSEVTEVVEVTPKTIYRDEQERPLKFEDLRAGDTVYAVVVPNAEGKLKVTSIRRGAMTVEELHRRYLKEQES